MNDESGVSIQTPQPTFPSVDILGVSIDCVDFKKTLGLIQGWLSEPANGAVRQMCTVNPEFVMEARRHPQFAAVLQRADLRAPDGVGILLAARLFGVNLHERVTGSDGIYRICESAAQHGWRVYLLGAGPGVAEAAAHKLTTLYPKLTICGTHAGSPAAEEWPGIRHRLETAQPDILFVAYGHPHQDIWTDRYRDQLPARVVLGVGGAFDFVAGVTTRAPDWVQSLGLEWLHRLLHEPWRWRRMAVLPLFAMLVIGQWIRQKLSSDAY